MNRRNLAMGGVAALAGLAGVGVAWRQFRPHEPGPALAGKVDDPFWAMSFDTPDGSSLAMKGLRGKPLLVNFWATWCPPCVEELPLLDSFYQKNKAKNWQLLGLAVDQPSAVRKWLQAKPLSFAVGMAGLGGTELSKSMGNVSGGLPFTVVFGASGELLHRKIGKVSAEDLEQWARLV